MSIFKNFTRTLVLTIGLALPLAVAPALADFEAGNQAYAKRDYDTAFKAWLPLAEAGDPAAQNNIGFMYRKGRAVTPDDATAFSWYMRSAQQGFADAMTNKPPYDTKAHVLHVALYS